MVWLKNFGLSTAVSVDNDNNPFGAWVFEAPETPTSRP
jgi:hypothetical protein